MTITEMQYDFRFKVDKVDSLSQEDFTVAEIDWLLNEAQNVLVKQRYGTTNAKRQGFESTQKRIDDLRNLVIKAPDQPDIVPSLLDTGVYEIPLDDLKYPYWFMISARASINEQCDKWVKLTYVQHDDLNMALEDPFSKPSAYELLYNFGKASDSTSGAMYIYPGSNEIFSVRLEYIKQPSKMNFGGYPYIDGVTYPQSSCELSEHIHSEIVDVAVEIASGIIQHPEYVQLKQAKLLSHE